MAEASRHSQIAPGYRLDRYEMLCPIAEGGMASVWIARLRGKRGFEKLVAIKMILPKYAEDPRFERMFLDEAALAARIEHANVAQVLDLGEEHDILYLAMELVDGDSLQRLHRTVLKRGGAIPLGIILRVMSDVCGGLHAAHELKGDDGQSLGVVHRDVSPHNVLVSMSGSAKLIDFGIAKARDRVSDDTADGTMKGKIHYMGPEQALGKPVDRRADIWAVGSCIYYLITGRAPYAAENDLATLHLIASGSAPTPMPPGIHPAVRNVVHRALAPTPELRFQAADQLQHALEMAMVEAGCITSTSNVATFVQEHMAERARKRKEGLELALSAAAQREQVAKMLERAGAESSSGLMSRTPGATHNTDSSVFPPPLDPSNPQTGSSATLGSGALASPVPAVDSNPRHTLAAAIGLTAGLLVAGVSGYFYLHHGEAPEAAAAAASPPPPANVAPPPTPPPPPLPPPAAEIEPVAAPPVVGVQPAPIPTMADSALPVAPASPPAAVHHPMSVAASPSPRPAPSPKTAAAPKHTHVDDGF